MKPREFIQKIASELLAAEKEIDANIGIVEITLHLDNDGDVMDAFSSQGKISQQIKFKIDIHSL